MTETAKEHRKRVVDKLLQQQLDFTLIQWIKENSTKLQYYLDSGNWTNGRIAPSKVAKELINSADLWREQIKRKADLESALHQAGLILRNDSSLCKEYISGGAGDIPYIVNVLTEMDWFYTQTDYKTLLKSEYKTYWDDIRGNGIYVPREEIDDDKIALSDKAKHRVLENLPLGAVLPTKNLQSQYDKIMDERWQTQMFSEWNSLQKNQNTILPPVLNTIIGQYLFKQEHYRKRKFEETNHCNICDQAASNKCISLQCGRCCNDRNCKRHKFRC